MFFLAFPPILIMKTDFTHWQASNRHHIITVVLRVDSIVLDGDLDAVSYLCPVHVSGRQISSHCFKLAKTDGRRGLFVVLLLFSSPCRWVVLPLTTLSSCPTLDPVAHQAWPPPGWWAPDPPLWEACMVRKDSVCPSTPVTPGDSRDLRHDTSRG